MWHLPASPGIYVVDRRRRTVASVHDCVCPVVAIHEYRAPSGLVVWVSELSPDVNPSEPFVADNQAFRRLLDHFYLPSVADPELAVALFDLCAVEYERLIDTRRNISNISTLLRVAMVALRTEGAAVQILDFGCGTGLASEALLSLAPSIAASIHLTGTDRSEAMLEAAMRRGLRILPAAAWLATAAGCFDAIIASYVFHFGVSEEDIRAFSRKLRRGGVLVANLHHGKDSDIEAISYRMTAVGLVPTELPFELLADLANPILLFKLS